jgi:hypothetical protein
MGEGPLKKCDTLLWVRYVVEKSRKWCGSRRDGKLTPKMEDVGGSQSEGNADSHNDYRRFSFIGSFTGAYRCDVRGFIGDYW